MYSLVKQSIVSIGYQALLMGSGGIPPGHFFFKVVHFVKFTLLYCQQIHMGLAYIHDKDLLNCFH